MQGVSQTTAGAAGGPGSDIDLYSDALLADPYPAYRTLRDLGSAVYLDRVDAWFIGRFRDVRSALNDWQTFSSAKGIGLNPIINEAWDEALICQDPPVHTERRKVMTEVLSPVALKPLAETIDARAAQLADRLIATGEFDAVKDFAHDLPVGVVMDLIGWPEDVRPRLLELAEGSWNAAGPDNAKMRSGLTQLGEMMALITEIYDNDRILPGGFAAQLIGHAHAGHITRDTAIGMLAGYIVAAFETTISAMASGIWLFAENPGEWAKLKERPALATMAANEIVRIEAPLQNFSRWCTRDAEMSDGTVVPAGARVIVSYASANRDERQFSDPDRFIIDRKEKQNLGFGHGPHGCAGQGLARMELTAVFSALAARVDRFEITGAPERALNNIARAFRTLPARAVAS
ncbi:cytochrome P450 [Aurantiacibacter xanthus]|uniref:Cytochrome P450 n=1 Tax=Aurantiacibacter xanthus TaxID=1784712 RepID=A0A3A1PCD6_9SPHN|nr:cytochrome P450 [Aurantiacibacter xanthus]RIV90665.1 cytochrome P450 [Aurantiacibacter xanthus]